MQENLMKVILAESRPECIRTIRKTLKDAGIPLRVSRVDSPPAALAALRRRPGDVVVVGLTSPADLDGEAVLAIREAAALAPVIAVADRCAAAADARSWTEVFADILPREGLTAILLGRSLLYAQKRHQTMNRLREREAQLGAVFQQSALGILITRTGDGRIVYTNRSFQQMLAYSGEELLGMTHDGIVHPEDRDAALDLHRKAASGKRDWYQMEKRYVSKDGRLIWGRLTVSLSRDGEAGNGLAVGMVEDITAHRQAEEATSALIMAIPDRMFRIRSDGTFLDYKAVDSYSRAASRPLAQTRLSSVLSPEAARLTEEAVGRALKTREMQVYEYTTAENGRRRYWETRMVPCGRRDVIAVVRDVTGQRSMEAALRAAYDGMEACIRERTADLVQANEALLEEIDRRKMSEFIINAVHEFMTLINKDYCYEAVNDAYCRALGKSPGEIVGRTVADIWGKRRFAGRIKPLIDRCLKGEIVRDESWIDLDGRERGYFAMTYYPYSGHPPAATHAVVISHDLTERKQAEKIMQDARRRQQAILDNIPDMAWLKDRGGFYIAANRVFAEACGTAQGDIPGKTDADLWPPELAGKYRQDDNEVMQSGRRMQIEEPIIYKNGDALWVETIKTPICDNRGRIMGTTGISRDITERKHSATVVEKERRRLFSLLEELPVFVYLQDRDHSIRFANLFFRKQFGDPQGKKCYQVIARRKKPCPQCMPFQVFESRQHQTWEWLHAPEGRMYQIYDYPFTDTDGSLLVLEMGIDITAFRQAEKRLESYQEELRSLSSQLTLAEERERRRISCELHDHIGQNLAYCKIRLGELCMDLTSGALRERAGEIRETIEQTILYTRTLTCELSPPILYELGLEAAVEWLGDQLLAGKGIGFSFEDDGRPKPLSDDVRVLVFQSVRELLINIAKHSQAKHCSVAMSRMHDAAVVAVKDDGVGFDTSGLFDAGNRDAGYGLFSIRERFKNIGGDFHLLSVPGGGSFAMMSVPLDKSPGRKKP